MLKLIAYRLAQSLLSLVIVTALTFALLASAGGDALTAASDDPAVSEAATRKMREVYGLDRPLILRYWRWLSNAARGDLGESFFYRAPVAGLILPRLVKTIALGVTALAFALTLSLALGIMSARRGGWVDRACELLITLTASTPRIVVALALLALASGTSLLTLPAYRPGSAIGISQALLPALALSVPLIALFLAQVREAVSETLREDFVRAARAKGLSEKSVIVRHVLRPALGPVITIFGYSLGSVMSGSVIVESVLGWPGLGLLSVNAVRSRDVPLLMGVVLMTAAAVFVGNLIADILLCLNDPRIRENRAEAL
jgi:peptide/nickel transport system permease protein